MFELLFYISICIQSAVCIQCNISKDIIRREAARWCDEFEKSISQRPSNQEHIYKLFERGLIYNYYRKFNRSLTEKVLISTFKLIANNTKMMDRMTGKQRAFLIPNPFEKLYFVGTDTLRKEMHSLALRANWDLTILVKTKQRSLALQNQETLRSMKQSPNDQTKMKSVPSVVASCKQCFGELSSSNLSSIDAEIALTTFALTLDVMVIALPFHPHLERDHHREITESLWR